MSSGLVVSGVALVLDRQILSDIDVEFAPGTITAVSGPSGSGKTTLLSIAGGLLEPTAGAATYDGIPTWRGTGDPRPEIAFVLQVYGLVPILSAAENVAVALRARGIGPDEADEQALASLARFGIGDLGDRQVEELSGGQMQRVALARGLAVGAEVLLADEPTSELDEINRGLVLVELRAEARRGAVVVVATHDPAVVEACDRHIVIDEGRIADHVAPVDLAAGRAHEHEGYRHQTGTGPGGADDASGLPDVAAIGEHPRSAATGQLTGQLHLPTPAPGPSPAAEREDREATGDDTVFRRPAP